MLLDDTIDLTFPPRITWQDQLLPSVPQQRVQIEELQDDTAIRLPTTPTITVPSSRPTPLLPPPPWTPYDLASSSGTALTSPGGHSFRRPNTADRPTYPNTEDRVSYLASRILDLEDELTRSRTYYSSTD